MENKVSIIITSISAPNAVMKSYASEAKNHAAKFIVIGDSKTPADFALNGCSFYSIDEQKKLSFKLAKLLPEKHYSRKNLGYLIAKESEMIVETDDDNFPRPDFWQFRKRNVETTYIDNSGWTNVYKYFSKENIWPRGFPLEQLSAELPSMNSGMKTIICPIQQGLADVNPDVDAVYRMTLPLPIDFEKGSPVALGKNSWCPFNSQNTSWFKEAFALLYLPSYCSFRMTDIWRSFVAQRIAWTCGWPILFHSSNVWQDRNEHDLLKDFIDEIPGYVNNKKICSLLEDLDLNDGIENIADNFLKCYSMMVENSFVGKEEMSLAEAWITDIQS